MDQSFLFLGIMGCLSAAYIALGYFLSKDVKTKSDFFLGGRTMGVLPITATLLATQIGGGMFLGTAEHPFKGLLYIIGMIFGFIALGIGIADRYRIFKVDTLGGLLKQQYNHTSLHTITAFLSVLSIAGILLGQAVAARSVIHHFTGMESTYLFPVFWFLMVAYTLLGGFKAVVITDMIQVGIVIVVFSGLFVYMLFNSPTSVFSAEGFSSVTTLFKQTKMTWPEVIRFATVPFFFSLITQDLVHRFFAAKDRATASLSALTAGLILFAFAMVPFYFGIQTEIQGIVSSDGVSPLLPLLQNYCSTFFFMLASCALVSAIGSTIDSLLCAGSSIICSITEYFITTNLKQEVHLSQAVTLTFGSLILGLSYFIPTNIIDILVSSYEISVACLIIPTLFALFYKKGTWTHKAAFSSILFGFGGFLLSKFSSHPFILEWGFFVSLGLSLFGFLCGAYLLPRK